MKITFFGQLEAFRATMVCGTVIGAAEVLNLSQPAVSRAIARLEKNLNVALFDRRKGRLIATPEAHVLFDQVARSFVEIDRLRDVAAEICRARTGTLHIATSPSVGAYFLPRVASLFKRDHPDVRMTLEVQTSLKIEDQVFTQAIDFGIAEFPFRREGLQSETFCVKSQYLIARSEHRLAAAPQASPHDLVGEEVVTLMPGQIGRNNMDNIFRLAGVELIRTIETQNYQVILELVADGTGIGIVDPFTASVALERGLSVVPFSPPIPFRLELLHPEHRALSRPAKSFLTLLRRERTTLLDGLPTARVGELPTTSSGRASFPIPEQPIEQENERGHGD